MWYDPKGIVCCYYSVLQVVAKYYTFYTSRESNSKVNKRYVLNGKEWLEVLHLNIKYFPPTVYCPWYFSSTVDLVVIMVASSVLLLEFC